MGGEEPSRGRGREGLVRGRAALATPGEGVKAGWAGLGPGVRLAREGAHSGREDNCRTNHHRGELNRQKGQSRCPSQLHPLYCLSHRPWEAAGGVIGSRQARTQGAGLWGRRKSKGQMGFFIFLLPSFPVQFFCAFLFHPLVLEPPMQG